MTNHGVHLFQLTRWTPLFPVNGYLVKEVEGLTLVDAGLPGSAGLVLRAAEAIGDPIRRIVLTHAHWDHAGSLVALRERTNRRGLH